MSKRFKYYKQETKYTCGAAAVRMVLENIGISKSEKQVVKLLKTNKIRGTWIKNFPEIFEKFKLNYFVGRNMKIKDLKKYIKRGYIIIVNYFIPEDKVDHYAVLKKIDWKWVYLFDPWYGPEHKYRIKNFIKNWHSDYNFEKEESWFLAVKK